MTTITTQELQDRLNKNDPVTVLDIRPRDDYEDWHVPDSLNIPAANELARGDTTSLEDLTVDEEPVVTVCQKGIMAREATQGLRERGIHALTLEGGLTAWSTAWNTASLTLPETETTIMQVRRIGKGCLSYIVANQGEAAVIDPALDASLFQRIAEENGWRITNVLETHLHADHVTRARPLAQATNAEHRIPVGEPARFDHSPIQPGDRIPVGNARIEALATPGHTPGSQSFLLDEAAVFTGDTLFVNAIGRPDLKADGNEEEQARLLHASIERLLTLGEETVVLPAHCDRPLGFDESIEAAYLGDLPERIGLVGLAEDRFVSEILHGLPEPPDNHEIIVEHNREGSVPTGRLPELEAGANRCAAGS